MPLPTPKPRILRSTALLVALLLELLYVYGFALWVSVAATVAAWLLVELLSSRGDEESDPTDPEA